MRHTYCKSLPGLLLSETSNFQTVLDSARQHHSQSVQIVKKGGPDGEKGTRSYYSNFQERSARWGEGSPVKPFTMRDGEQHVADLVLGDDGLPEERNPSCACTIWGYVTA